MEKFNNCMKQTVISLRSKLTVHSYDVLVCSCVTDSPCLMFETFTLVICKLIAAFSAYCYLNGIIHITKQKTYIFRSQSYKRGKNQNSHRKLLNT